jgi:hypothetical protein
VGPTKKREVAHLDVHQIVYSRTAQFGELGSAFREKGGNVVPLLDLYVSIGSARFAVFRDACDGRYWQKEKF